jgi:hypothetical protein
MPRKRLAPARYSTGTGEGHHPADPKDIFRQQYFECLDVIIAFTKDRFDQPSFHILKQLESLLLKAARKEAYSEELKFVLMI